MEYLLYLSRFLYRIRWWLLFGTAFITLIAFYLTRSMTRSYSVETTLYTGIVSGYTIEGNGANDWSATQNAIDNLVSIIKAESTLKRVSYRLYARNMIHGDLEHDNEYITAASFREIYNRTVNRKDGKQLLALIDKSSEDKTVENLIRYERPSKDNFIYGLFYWNHPHYSYNSLKEIGVNRKNSSDLLEIGYSSNDPGVAYNTINILMEEFVNEYRNIRYGETDKVIEYFRGELKRIGTDLQVEEDDLTQYNIEKRIINYYDETREIASINKEFELREQDATINYNSSKVTIEELEKRMDDNTKSLINNIQFVNKIKEASTLTGKISELETFSSKQEEGKTLENYKDRLTQTKNDLSGIADKYVTQQFSKEGIAKKDMINQWLEQILKFEKAKSDLNIIQQSRRELDDKYVFFAPVGSTIKRKERSIGFAEKNYLSILESLNTALMRKKSLEMTSATLKVITPPAYPISPHPTMRKKIIMGACAGGFLFILGFLLLIELLDRTLRDKIRAERLTGHTVLGAFPANSLFKHRSYNKIYGEIATKQLSNSILPFFTNVKKKPSIVNFLSTQQGEGKSFLSEKLITYWTDRGLVVRKLTEGIDFDQNSREFLLANSILDLCPYENEDIIIVEYQDLTNYSASDRLLQEANLNILIARADRGWKENDKLLLNKLNRQVGSVPLYIYLNNASRIVVENYTGMLPPYTFIRKQMYRLSQLALTERIRTASPQKSEEDDNG